VVFDFWPTDNGFIPGKDVRDFLNYFAPPEEFDRLQINCWKRLPEVRVDLATHGGHEVTFPKRSVFPIRFLLRHYPIRSQEHGERKIFRERLPRFLPEERAIGWHRQYLESGHSHLRPAAALRRFDMDAARLGVQVENRLLEALCFELASLQAPEGMVPARVAMRRESAIRIASLQDKFRLLTAERDAYFETVERQRATIVSLEGRLRDLESQCRQRLQESDEVARGLTVSRDTHAREAERRGFALAAEQARLAEILASRSWRWSAPVRRLLGLLSSGSVVPAVTTPPRPGRPATSRRSTNALPVESNQPRLSFVLPLALAGTGRPGNDLARASLLFDSFERCFSRNHIATFLVVTRPQDLDAVSAALARAGTDYVDLVSETAICPELADDPPSSSDFPSPNSGWYRQQLLKLGAARHLDSSFYMTLDADVVFTRPFAPASLISEQRAIVNTQTADDLRLLLTDYMAQSSCEIRRGRDDRARAILGLSRTRDCFYGETPVVFNTSLVRALLDHLELSGKTSWARYLLLHLPWTELSLYFTFAEATGAYANHHVDGGFDAVLAMSDSLWYPPADYRVPRALADWTWTRAATECGVAVVVQSYLGYKVEDIRARLRQISRGW
jgi:hypothetical protein